jgi:hypothetical protein
MNNVGWYQNPYGYGQDIDRNRIGYGGYAQQGYGQMQNPQQNQPLSLYDVIGQSTRVDWVQGEAAVKSYMVRPGMSVILLDLDNPNRLYVKACNMAGVPIFTEGFDLGKIQLGNPTQLSDDRYVPREEYEKSMNQISKLFAGLTEKIGMTEAKEEKNEHQNEPAARMGYESERTAEHEYNSTGAGIS